MRKILKQSFRLSVDLIRTEVTEGIAKEILCHLLELNIVISDKDLKKAYRAAVLHIHPDKLNLKSGEEAFKVLNAAYSQAKL